VDPRFLAAKLTASTLKFSLRLVGSGGTAAPGLVAGYIDSKSLKKLSTYVSDIVLVSGTNGKTTTSRIIGSSLDAANIPYIHNREGSNLLRGIVGTLFSKTPLFPQPEKPVALLEVDEAALPLAISQTTPRVIVLNNLFRDQLDRYGEIETIRKLWEKTLRNLDDLTTLVLNSDDPSVAHLAQGTKAKVVYFGIENKTHVLKSLPHASDFANCTFCGKELVYDSVYLSHLGKYKCRGCKKVRPKPDIYAQNIELNNESGFKASIVTPEGKLSVKTSLPGLYNVYNSLAAISCALALNIAPQKTIQALKNFEAAFGRTETVSISNKKLFLALAKNPTGFNELIRTVFTKSEKRYVLIIINDLIADGRDVSWLWDVDFEQMKGKVKKIWVSGIRAADMSLRLKYAGLEIEGFNSNIEESLESAYSILPEHETLFVFPTYTAMLETKKYLSKKGHGERFWED
jgi:UDP-N-acetylmuramyl tripeptide synthase